MAEITREWLEHWTRDIDKVNGLMRRPHRLLTDEGPSVVAVEGRATVVVPEPAWAAEYEQATMDQVKALTRTVFAPPRQHATPTTVEALRQWTGPVERDCCECCDHEWLRTRPDRTGLWQGQQIDLRLLAHLLEPFPDGPCVLSLFMSRPFGPPGVEAIEARGLNWRVMLACLAIPNDREGEPILFPEPSHVATDA